MTRFNIKSRGAPQQQAPMNSSNSTRPSSQPPPAQRPRVVVQAPAARRQINVVGVGAAQAQQNQISQLRDKSLKSDKWNLFVGDSRYKTNFFLQFRDRFTRLLYEKNILLNTMYSVRMLLTFMILYDLFVVGYESCSLEGCFMNRVCSLAFFGISLFGTLKQAKQFQPKARCLLMQAMPFYWSLRILSLHDGNNDLLISFIFYLPTFILGIIILADWLEYLVFSAGLTIVSPIIFKMVMTSPVNLSLMSMYSASFSALILYVLAFGVQEKIKKEHFVIGFTNSQTKKLLFGLFNAQPHPIAIIGQDGTIHMCNQPFEAMLQQRLNIRQVPASIYKLTQEDDESTARLKQFILDILKPQGSSGFGGNITMNNLKNSENSFYGGGGAQQVPSQQNKKIEIKLTKSELVRSGLDDQQKKRFKEQAKEDTKSNSTISERTNAHHKDLFEKYEIALMQGESVNYLSKKAVMITFSIISEQKAKNRLIFLHTQLMYKFLFNFNRRLMNLNQQLANKPIADEELVNNSSLVEFLGNTYVAINQVQLIQHEFWMRSDTIKTHEENFLLQLEILQCVESLSVKCLSASTTLKLDASSGLPEKCFGDVQRFRLALQAVSEFSMKYCIDGIIEIAINLDKFVDTKYLIAFEFVFSKNSQYNEEPLINLLNSLSKSSQVQMEDLLLKNYEDLFDLISQFGIGMLMFPGLIMNLDGSYQISTIDSPHSEHKEEEKIPPFEGEQDQAHPVSSNKGGKIKILFKIPFSQGDFSKRVMSPYTPINKTKSVLGSAYILKSPNLGARENRKQALSQVRQIMDGRSPLLNNQPRGSSVPPGGSNLPMGFNHFKQNLPGNHPLMSAHASGFTNENSNNLQVGDENSFCNNSHNNSSNKIRKNSQLVTPNVDKSIVKRVENKLKNLESKHPQTTNLFGNNNQRQLPSHRDHHPLTPNDEKQAMELTNSRKSSQQCLPSNALIAQKAQELAPIQDSHRTQSMNYIAPGFSSNNIPGQANYQQYNSQKSNGNVIDHNHNPFKADPPSHRNSLHLIGSGVGVHRQHDNSGSATSLNPNIKTGGSSDNLGGQSNKDGSKGKKKPSLFIKINHLDDDSDRNTGKKIMHSHTEDVAAFAKNLNSKGAIVPVHSQAQDKSGQSTPSNKQKSQSHQFISKMQDKTEEQNMHKIVEQQQHEAENRKQIDRDRELDNFLLGDQNQELDLSQPLRTNSKQSSKSFKVTRTLNPNEISKGINNQKVPDLTNKQDISQDDVRKILSFGQGLSHRDNQRNDQNKFANLSNFFVQTSNQQNSMMIGNQKLQHSNTANKVDLSATLGGLGLQNLNNNNGGKLQPVNPYQESEMGVGTPNLRQPTIHHQTDQNDNLIDLNSNCEQIINQDQSAIRFGQESPIQVASDGLENFDSNDISEDDNTSEILAVLSHNLDDQEESKVHSQVQSAIKNKNAKENERSNSYSKLDNSFDKVSQNLSGADRGRILLDKRRKHSKTRRLNSRPNKHEPLSKHIPKDILNTYDRGASKNLLQSKEGSLVNGQNSPGMMKRVAPDTRPKQPSLIYDDPVHKNSFGQESFYNPSRYQQSYGYDENTCPFRKSKKTMEYQHQLRKEDYSRCGSSTDNTSMMAHIMSRENSIKFNPSVNTQQLQNAAINSNNSLASNFVPLSIGGIRVWNEESIKELKDAWEKLIIPINNPRHAAQNNASSGQILPLGMGGRQATYRDDTLKYVLIAEDNIMVSFILEEMLKTMNYTPIVAVNGRIAVEKFTSFMKDDLVFDLILMDIYMPEMSGYEATKAIRQIEQTHGILETDRHFICGFSAEKNDNVLKKCLEAGMNDLYDKNMSKEILTDLLNKCKRPPRQPMNPQEQHSIGVDRLDLTMLPGQSAQISRTGTQGNGLMSGGSMLRNL